MIRSMTGFGRGKFENEGREYTVEIKSVNHKYSDISIKLPRQISYLEENVRKEVSKRIARGKIDIFITMQDFSEKGKSIKINKEIAKVYISELRDLANETGISSNIDVIDISKFPEVLNISNEENEEIYWTELSEALNIALDKFVAMREIEGNKICDDFKVRMARIKEKVSNISDFSAGLVEEYIVKLNTRVKELMKTDIIDENRLAQEIVIFSDKSSIQEELTRLDSHISQFLDLVNNANGPIGKKCDFIIQEMNREVNTIGSKANSMDISKGVIELKTEIEDVREQIQNIE
ncbi:MAG: YicC/YloC family endoribonuclease [Clostridia bacterium]|nr:YicC family protein [Clostridia bacterium]